MNVFAFAGGKAKRPRSSETDAAVAARAQDRGAALAGQTREGCHSSKQADARETVRRTSPARIY